MKSPEDVAIILMARLNSQRIPRKMVAPFAGTTLLDIALGKLLSSKAIPRRSVILSACEPEIVAVGERHGVAIFRRSALSANSEGARLADIYDWHDKLPHTYAMTLNPCLPFLSVETIDGFYNAFLHSPYEGMFAVVERKSYFWDAGGNLLNAWPEGMEIINTKAVAPTYEAAHCIYAGRLDLIPKGIWCGTYRRPHDPEFHVVPASETFDIDHPWQFKLAERMYIEFGGRLPPD